MTKDEQQAVMTDALGVNRVGAAVHAAVHLLGLTFFLCLTYYASIGLLIRYSEGNLLYATQFILLLIASVVFCYFVYRVVSSIYVAAFASNSINSDGDRLVVYYSQCLDVRLDHIRSVNVDKSLFVGEEIIISTEKSRHFIWARGISGGAAAAAAFIRHHQAKTTFE